MRQKRRSRKVSFQVESLDDRAVPSSLSFSQLRQVTALQRAAAARAARFPAASLTASARLGRSSTLAAATAAGRATRVSSAVTIPTRQATFTPRVQAPTNVTNPRPAAAGDIDDVKNGPMAKAGQELIRLYQEYVRWDGEGTFRSSLASSIQIVGTSVRVDVRGSGNVNSLAGALANLGMQVEMTDARTRTVEGLLPITQLVNAAQLSQVANISPVSVPARR